MKHSRDVCSSFFRKKLNFDCKLDILCLITYYKKSKFAYSVFRLQLISKLNPNKKSTKVILSISFMTNVFSFVLKSKDKVNKSYLKLNAVSVWKKYMSSRVFFSDKNRFWHGSNPIGEHGITDETQQGCLFWTAKVDML